MAQHRGLRLAVVGVLLLVACKRAGPPSRASAVLQAEGLSGSTPKAAAADPLPAWRDGATKRAILAFVADVSNPSSPRYVVPAERVAAFDNDGTLWMEKPFPPEQSFEFDRVRSQAATHPDWAHAQPFAAVLAGDDARLSRMTRDEEIALIDATHAGMTVPAFRAIARTWLDTWTDPRFGRHPTGNVYEPMIELLAELRRRGFTEFLCSGDTIEFLRSFAPRSYGVPEDRVAGTALLTGIDERVPQGNEVRPALVLEPTVVLPYNTYRGKPINLQRLAGRLPVLVVGNEDGDLPLLELSTAGPGPHLAMLVRHDDAEREYAYDKGAERALRAARAQGWTVISMKQDWATVFPR